MVSDMKIPVGKLVVSYKFFVFKLIGRRNTINFSSSFLKTKNKKQKKKQVRPIQTQVKWKVKLIYRRVLVVC
jgi:hypothetical protein